MIFNNVIAVFCFISVANLFMQLLIYFDTHSPPHPSTKDRTTMKTHPFALLILTDDLTVKQFQTKDELKIAVQSLNVANIPCIALIWNNVSGVWTQPEMLHL